MALLRDVQQRIPSGPYKALISTVVHKSSSQVKQYISICQKYEPEFASLGLRGNERVQMYLWRLSFVIHERSGAIHLEYYKKRRQL